MQYMLLRVKESGIIFSKGSIIQMAPVHAAAHSAPTLKRSSAAAASVCGDGT